VVNRVLPDAELAAESLEFARGLAAGPTRAHHATKRIVRTSSAPWTPSWRTARVTRNSAGFDRIPPTCPGSVVPSESAEPA
jgi:hypothetical protein